jgi:hypothetical protein
MLGTGLHFGRARGEDRFYNPAKARRAHQNRQNEQLRRAQSDVTAAQLPAASSTNREPENRAGSGEAPKPVAVPAFEPVVAPPLSNLERFLQSISPSVPALYPSKVR